MNPAPFYVTPDVLASREKRFVNFIIDIIGYYVLTTIVGVTIGILELIGVTGILDFILNLGTLGEYIMIIMINLMYFTAFETFTQRTLGKYISGTKVVLKDGSKPTINEILIRSLCRFIPFEAFSFLGSLGKGWHDTLSNTYVVDVKKFKSKMESTVEIEQIGRSEEQL